MKVKALRKIIFHTSKGEVIVKPGQIFKPAEPEKLIKAGLAVPITDQVGRPYWLRPDGSCYVCHGIESWLSVHGVTVCAKCHPPAQIRLVSKWGHA